MSRNGNLKGKLASHRRLPALVAILIVCMCAGVAPAAASSGSVQPLSSTPSKTQAYAACAPKPAGVASCLAVVEPVGARLASVSADAVAPTTSGIDGSGLAPSELQSAYKLSSSSAGSGQTVAIVDAYNDPTAESDLAAYRAAYGLPACTTAGGCFDKVNQTGGKSYPPQPTAEQGDWPIEESLDLDMVSAICPNCHIVLVEANSAGMEDLGAAENEAAKLGTEVSNSWGSFEFNGETAFDSYFDHPGIPITVASGDYGYDNEEYSAGVPSYPAASPDVIAVGGTNLTPAENSRGWTESVWAHSGSGCSHYEPKPSYQTDSGCSKRTTNDIAAAAEDLSIYDTSGTVGESEPGWFPVGGTSAATPIIASYEALSSSEVRSEGASAFYKNTSSFFPVTSGSNGSCGGSYLCTGGSGYRGPTGVGTPDGVIGGGGSAPAPKLEVTSVSPKEGPTAGGTSVTIKGADFVKGATVKIGVKAATSVTVRSESEITAVTAAGAAGSDEVIVTDEHGTSSGGPSFTYVAPPAPSVSSVTPATGTSLGGTTVTVKGSGFTSSSKVTIGSKAGEVTVLSEHELTAVTKKSTAGAAEVVVSNANGTSSGGPSFTYVAPPVPAV
ncbi:MAG TPA: IPT/TIG domain-containing protein, partial [Solirubrobacteraceae bacterium]|nr:IPT/TIG domain-containing protein [Solirubrobacteraceae bacterium]